MPTKKRLRKPTRKRRNPIYEYSEIIDYIEEKYKIQTRDYAGKFKKNAKEDTPYLDFWHWLVDSHGIENGCELVIDIPEIREHYDAPKFVLEILDLIEKEFGEQVECSVWW